ncbi:hypothetical protein F441_21953 [Phytophthora nicotianae CJ01A1]|uniref:Uncharacterized protein n=1 Tax=Phytophthora nicotianae CJ01A1 TaxID=1317063 RepID=W2VR23_PHYNI|nr:hypothetical protein F441_21953 [Phytophthora nicotianae CJ01A1]
MSLPCGVTILEAKEAPLWLASCSQKTTTNGVLQPALTRSNFFLENAGFFIFCASWADHDSQSAYPSPTSGVNNAQGKHVAELILQLQQALQSRRIPTRPRCFQTAAWLPLLYRRRQRSDVGSSGWSH